MRRRGWTLGRRYATPASPGDLLTPARPRARFVELTIHGAGRYLIREDAKDRFSVVPAESEWDGPILTGSSLYDAAERMAAR